MLSRGVRIFGGLVMTRLCFVSHHYHVPVAPRICQFFFFFKKISQRNKRVKERRGGLGLLPTPGFSGSENMLVYVIMQ